MRLLLDEVRGQRRSETINKYSSLFYTHIPHDFGMKNISGFQLDNEKKIKDKLEMLQSIQDIQYFTKIINEIPSTEMSVVDTNYAKLGVEIVPLEKGAPMYNKIIEYVSNTQAEKHSKHFKVEVIDIFEIKSTS